MFSRHNTIASRADRVLFQSKNENQPKVERYSIRNIFSKSSSELKKTDSKNDIQVNCPTKIVRNNGIIKDFGMLIKMIQSPKVKDFTDRHSYFEESFQKLSNAYEDVLILTEDISSKDDYKTIKSQDGFKNICDELKKLKETSINLYKIVKEIEQNKLKIVCEIVENEGVSDFVHERDIEMKETCLKIIDCKMECKKLYIYLNLQKSLVDLLSTLKSTHLPDYNSEEFDFFRSMLNFCKPKYSTYDEKFDIIDSQDELELKKLMIDPKYCAIDVKTLQKLDQFAGMIIDSSKQLKRENIFKARELIDTISPEAPVKGDIDIPVFKVQRLIYVINGLLIGKYDSFLNSTYANKQKYEDKKQKEIADEVIKEMKNLSILQKINDRVSNKNLDEIFKTRYQEKKEEDEKYLKYYDLVFFDKNIKALMDTLQNSGATTGNKVSFSFTNVNGLQNNVFVQNGSSLTQGGVYLSGRNTIGPAFYVNLIGSNIEADLNAMGTIHNGNKIVVGT